MSVEAGGTFKCNEAGFIGDDEHLWIILSDPIAYPDQVVLVNVSSSTNARRDPACTLRYGDHGFIRHDSFVYYRGAKIVKALDLRGANISHSATLTSAILMRVREGAAKTQFIPRYIKKLLIEQGVVSEAS
jgi:hypothetical protein